MHKTKWEFSKIILIYAAIINTIVVVSTIIMVFFTRDCTPLIYLIPAVSAEVATGTGFYYWKARLENKIKLMSIYDVKPDQNSFN